MSRRKKGKGKYHQWLTKEGLLKIEGWARDGLTNEQIATNMGIVESTFYEWQNKYEELSEALKKGKEVVDREVENALLKRALGYEYEEVKIEEEEDGSIKKTVTTKRRAGDVTAQIFWLKNRKPYEWRDRKNLELEGAIETNPYKGLTTEELRKIIDED